MSTSGILVLVGSILGGLALFLVPLGVFVRRRLHRARAQMAAELATEPALRGPEQALYRGGSAGYPKLKGNGIIALTRRRLLFRILIGTNVDIPLDEITSIRESKSFQGSVVGGKVHLVVGTAAGEVGFFVEDNAAWIAAITSAGGPPPETPPRDGRQS